MGEPTGLLAFVSRRKIFLFAAFVFVIVLLYAVKEKYFYASDQLKPVVSLRIDSGVVNRVNLQYDASWETESGNKQQRVQVAQERNVWEIWVEKNRHLSPIGDIYDKCDNKTRKSIGKVVLEMSDKYGGVHITSYMNCSYNHDIKSSTAHLEVYYEDELFYEKDYDMCEAALKLDTPYSCPIPKGKLLIVRDVAKMPGYIPKGTYKISAYVKDQDASEIGCTFAEFKTGEKAT